jgi:GAF domain-containing protein
MPTLPLVIPGSPLLWIGGRFKRGKQMKHARLAVTVFGLLALAACGGNNPDKLNDVETNQPAVEDLNALSDQAANVAAESQALENQAEQLNNEAQNATGPETPADENIVGM